MTVNRQMLDGLLVRSIGTGEPTLLFVHGYSCSGTDWSGQLTELSHRYRCIALDLPGHGDSTADATPTMFALGQAVNRVKDSLSGPIILVGHSLGCKTIREAYRQSSARVAGIIFIDGSLYIGKRGDVSAAAREMLDRNGTEVFLANLVEGMFSVATKSTDADLVRTRARAMDLDFARDLLLDSVAWDLDHAVQSIRTIEVPTLVVQCMAFDASFGWRVMRPGDETPFMSLIRLLTPSPSFRTLTSSGHFPMFDAPEPLNQAIIEFAASLERSDPPVNPTTL